MLPRLIIIIGPQGAGKTTVAQLLKNLLEIRFSIKPVIGVISYYASIHCFFLRFIDEKLVKQSRKLVRLYPNAPPIWIADFRIRRKMFIFLVIINLMVTIVSLLLIKLRLMARKRLIIDDEGSLLRQIADILYSAKFIQLNCQSLSWKLIRFLVIINLRWIKKESKRSILIYLRAKTPEILLKRQRTRTRQEPLQYLKFQTQIYDALFIKHLVWSNSITIDHSTSLMAILNSITKFISEVI